MNNSNVTAKNETKLKFPVGAIILIFSQVWSLLYHRLGLYMYGLERVFYLLGIISSIAVGVLALCKKRGVFLVIPLAIAGIANFIEMFFHPFYLSLSLFVLSTVATFAFVLVIALLALTELEVLKAYKKILLYSLYTTFGLLAVLWLLSFFFTTYIENILFFIGGLFFGIWLADPYKKPKLVMSNNDTETSSNEYYIPIGKHVCLLIVTFGIWYFIWNYKTTCYTNLYKGEKERNPTNKLLLCIFVPFYSIYWTYKTALCIDAIAKERGVSSELGTVCLVLAFFVGFVPPILIQDKINATIFSTSNPTQRHNFLGNAEAIEKYKVLLDKGIITHEEFETKKKELLNL